MQPERRVKRQRDNLEQPQAEIRRVRRPIFQAEHKAPRRPIMWRKWHLRLGASMAVFFIIWALLFSQWFTVRGFEVKGSNTLSSQDVEEVFDAYIKQHPTEKNIFFVDTTQLSKALQNTYPTISKAYINRTLFLKLQVNVQETSAALIWQVGNTNWVLGDDGRILAQASGAERRLGTVRDTAQLPAKAGDRVTDRMFVSFVRNIYTLAPQQNLEVSSVEVGNTTIEANIRLNNNTVIKCDTTRGAREQLEAAYQTIQTAQRTGPPITQYIDVRAPGRVFYK